MAMARRNTAASKKASALAAGFAAREEELQTLAVEFFDLEEKSITSTRKDFGDKGSIILELKRQYSKKENEWITQGKIRFIYPEKGIDESLHEGTYWLTLEAKLKLKLTTEKQTFTYTDDPDEEGSNLFYFRNDCPIDHQNGLYIRINHPVTQEEE